MTISNDRDLVAQSLVDRGLRAADTPLSQQVATWARYTNEKADVAASLAKVVRHLHRVAPADRDLSVLSIGSSDEPQFRILHAFFRGGLYLFDIDEKALATTSERVDRRMLDGVFLVRGDYSTDFAGANRAAETLASKLGGQPFDLIALHHCLYYAEVSTWPTLIKTLYDAFLAPSGAMHLALMSARETDEGTTTWLYHHFARKFFGFETQQDLLGLRDRLVSDRSLRDARFLVETRKVSFWVDDFEKYMAVIWMILLYPDGHKYDLAQRTEIVEFVIEQFWEPRRPIIQTQDYLSIFRESSLAPQSDG